MKRIRSFTETEAFKYLVFGVLTTLVYYIFMYGSLAILKNVSGKAAISEAIGQIVSIIFAFYTNKKWVFEHESNHVFLDFLNFAAGRVIFMVLAIVLKWWFGDVHPSILMNLFHLSFDKTMLVFSLFIQILNILLNYFYSKFLVFRKK
ncbi:GtrA family protein [Lactococcus fujiensis]|uniref:GtcA family membrane protein n=1 Tax=Lactococcus fujiensis JCM 16395 TaxID=1291764 RepID=A0A2A5RPA0_9LACT|nr:GtrA family protein [Lactococcus fujiensis]PCS01258.1 GtcA family membrane protein [Lactococcus fujiensis JCM 16395]